YHFLKGAPEIGLAVYAASPVEQARTQEQIDQWAGEGLRVLGPSYRRHQTVEDHAGYSWAGLLAMEDPIRDGVMEAISVARRAGIQVKMITGDYRRTAERIGCNIGLMQPGDDVLEGVELASLNDRDLRER